MNRRAKTKVRLPLTAAAEMPLGALAGAALGLIAGPAAIVVGGVLGLGAGAALAVALKREEQRRAVDERHLDEDLGIIGGDIGAPNLEHPPATVGLYSGGAMGASGVGEPPAEGPIPEADA